MDAEPAYREQPAAVRARLMASAIRPDAFLEDVTQFPLHNGDGPGALQHRYGLGKVSARTSVLNRDEADGWFGGAAVVEVGDGEYGYRDIEVPAGASRLDIVMTWDERAGRHRCLDGAERPRPLGRPRCGLRGVAAGGVRRGRVPVDERQRGVADSPRPVAWHLSAQGGAQVTRARIRHARRWLGR